MDDNRIDERMKELTVLYVEDEETIREQMVQIFELRFGKVFSASNGEEGLEKFREIKPDIVVTDINMPKMDGLAMSEQIKEESSHTPIVVITAFSELENLTRAIDIGIDGFIKKPTKRDELLRVLRKTTKIVISEKEIRERDEIIQTVLGWHPFFSIISEKNHIEYVGNNLLQFLGYNTKEEFIESHCKVVEESDKVDSKGFCHLDLCGEELFNYIANSSDKDIIVYLRTKEGEDRAYLLRSRYLENVDLYFIAFIDPKNVVMPEEDCGKNSLCKICEFVDLVEGN